MVGRCTLGLAIVAAAIACGDTLASAPDDDAGTPSDAGVDTSPVDQDTSPQDAGCRISWDASARTFSDIAEAGGQTEIETLAEAGILDYCSMTRFCPTNGTLRREALRWAVRSAVASPADYEYACATFFTDLAPEEPDYAYMQKAKELGFTNGCSPNQVCPDIDVGRQGVTVFAVVLARSTPLDASAPTRFADVPPGGLSGFIERAAELDLVAGCPASAADPAIVADAGPDASFFCPNGVATREFIAVAYARARALR